MKKKIFIHIKILRGNFFILISNQYKRLVFNKSCGNLGIKNIQKRTNDAFKNLLYLSVQYLLNLSPKKQLFINIDAAKRVDLTLLNNHFIGVLKSYKFDVVGITISNKISHNGCRKSYFR
jgi:ribosomal protein S11